MAKYLKIAATSRQCNALPEDSGTQAADAVAAAYLDTVLREVMPQKPDLLLLPEMCDMPSGWGMQTYARYAFDEGRRFPAYVKEKAKELGIWIAYPTLRRAENGALHNSCQLLDRVGNTVAVYDKIHLTQGELELGMEPGSAPQVISCELGRIGFAICFDLNYTELAGEYRRQNADIILFPSLFHGGLLQSMWALSARSYLVGSCGGCGASAVAPTGQTLHQSSRYYAELVTRINLDYALLHLDFNREKLAKAVQKYGESVQIHDPGNLGTVMLTSESESITVTDIIKEFGLEPLDDYLRRF